MNNQAIIFILNRALKTLHLVATGYNPLSGHLEADRGKGGSIWDGEFKSIEQIIALCETAEFKEVIPGAFGALCFVFEDRHQVGEKVISKVIEGEKYKIEKVHGMLQPVGNIETYSVQTNTFTICLTPESVKGYMEFALASAYPGLPDNAAPIPGEYEGKEFDAKFIEENGWRPKAKVQ
jgi:hypothetical protein